MAAIPVVSMQPTGVTASASVENIIYIARATILELYQVINTEMLFITSVTMSESIFQLYISEFGVIIILQHEVKVLDRFSLAVLRTLSIETPGMSLFDYHLRPISAFCAYESILLVAAGHSRNYLNLYNLSTRETSVHRFSAGELVDLASYDNSLAILARTSMCDPSLTLNTFANLRMSYLYVFSVKGSKLTEQVRMTQLPSDAYALRAGFGGFIVLAPRYFIFKRLNFGDLRFRFSTLYEETEVDIEYIYQLFEKNFEQAINFDFRNLVKGKVINHLANNIQLENDYIHCITQRRLPLAPRCLLPGHPVPDLYEYFKFYGYNNEEISMKMNQVLSIIGDYPVCDFMLEAELRRYKDSNVNFIGIMNHVQNFMEIPPLYNCCFQAFDANYGIVVDENGLMFTLYINEEEVRMYPIIYADKDAPIRTDMRTHSISLLYKTTSQQNLFTFQYTGELRQEFVVFMGSFTQDSYVCRLQLCKDVPADGYYKDYRQKSKVTGSEYRQALLDEIKKNCAIINRDNESTTREIRSTETVRIGTEFFSTEINRDVLSRLFPKDFDSKPCQAFQGADIFGISQDSRQTLLENVEHGVISYVSIIPSIAGVVDSAFQQVTSQFPLTSLFLLNNTGIVQRCQTRLAYKKVGFVPNIGVKTRNIHFLNEKTLEKEEEYLVVLVDKQQNKLLRVFLIDGSYKTEDCQLFPDLKQKVILATYVQDSDCTYVATTNDLFTLRFRNTQCRVSELSSDVLVHASFYSQGVIACSVGRMVVYSFAGQRATITIEMIMAMIGYKGQGLYFYSCHAMDLDVQAFVNVFGTQEDFVATVAVTLQNSAVVYLGISYNLKYRLLFYWYPVDVLENAYSVRHSSSINQPVVELSDEKIWGPRLFSSVMPYFTKCHAGSNFYFFAATRGGSVCIFQYNKLSQTFYLIDGVDSPISPPPDKQNYYDIDYWANNYQIMQTDHYIRDVRPFYVITQSNLSCVLMSYPTPTKTTIPNARIAVPGLLGALSIFQIGQTVSSIRLTGTNLYPPNAFPPRCCFYTKGLQLIGLFDTKQPTNAQDVKTTETCSLGVFSLDYGRYYSSLFDYPFYRAMSCNYLQYSATLAQNAPNLRRTMIALPFYADKLVYHNKTQTIVIVGSVNRFEIRPPRSMTKDEVANIRIFETVQDEQDHNMKEEEIIQNCHSLIQRNPPPINSFASIHHQHLFLIARNVIVDSSQLELSRLEHANEMVSDLLFSNYPQRFGRYWQGHNVYMDRFGRMDRRNKNDDSTKRQEAFELQHQQTRQEFREMIIICSNYTLGSFQKCYGKIYVHAVEQVTEKTEQHDQDLQKQLQGLMDEQFQSRALRRNINTNFFILKQSRFPFGQKYFQLNKIAFEELQNAVTACATAPNAKCLMVGESKHIKCYELVDSQKLYLNAQWLGLGQITKITRHQDFFLVSDGICESKLFVFKNKGKRISEMSTLGRDVGGLNGEYLINQFNNQIYQVFSVNQNIAIFNYKYTEKKEKRERMQLVQVIPTGQTVAKLLKSLTLLPLPAEQKFQSGVETVAVTLEGSIIQIVPVPLELCQICGLEKTLLRIDGRLNVYDQQSSVGCQVTLKYGEEVSEFVQYLIQSKIRLSSGVW